METELTIRDVDGHEYRAVLRRPFLDQGTPIEDVHPTLSALEVIEVFDDSTEYGLVFPQLNLYDDRNLLYAGISANIIKGERRKDGTLLVNPSWGRNQPHPYFDDDKRLFPSDEIERMNFILLEALALEKELRKIRWASESVDGGIENLEL